MGRNRIKFDWQLKFEHAGRSIYVQGEDLDGAAERMISGHVNQGEWGRAELGAFVNSILIIRVEDKTVWNRNKQGRNQKIPSNADPERENATESDRLLTYIVTKRAPQLFEKHPQVFEDYYDEEVAAEMERGLFKEDGSQAPPTVASRGSKGSTVSPVGEET